MMAACSDESQKVRVTSGQISESVYASGVVKAVNQYQVFSPVTGIIDTIYVSEGDTIPAHGRILSVDANVPKLNKDNAALAASFTDIRANTGKLKEAELAVSLSKSKMANDSLMYARQKRLWQQQIGSKVELEQKALAYESSKTAYASARLNYNDLQRQLRFNDSQSRKNLMISGQIADDYVLKSKIFGTVYSIYKEKGEIVNPQTPLAVVGDAGNFILEMQVDEHDIFKIRRGLPVIVSFDSYKGQVFDAVVTKIDPLMNERGRTFKVEASLRKPPARLYPNISFEANIVLATKKKALLVPRSYVAGDSVAYRSNGDKIRVKTGLRDYRMIEITAGLSANDELMLPPE